MATTVAVLAGGQGTRIGGDKAMAPLNGRPLIDYPLLCAHDAGLEVCVVAKSRTRLPALNVPVLVEPDQPFHPLCGIVTALEAHSRVIALPCDMPFVTASVLMRLDGSAAQVMLAAPGEPFPALYTRSVLDVLRRALFDHASLRSVLQGLSAPALTGIDAALLFSVNSSEDLGLAERRAGSARLGAVPGTASGRG